jgi:ATP-dependent RNA helicase DeaD
MSSETISAFNQLALTKPILKVLDELGYESPSPIQALTIPFVMEGTDVLGQAQTGTGKTAAFALPILSRLDLKQKAPQVLVLAPTRELAIQVAEAFQKYATHIKGFHVLPIYGGQDYSGQIRGLKRGVHVVVGTPGRVMDHMRRGTLKLDELTTLVLDEADEMLRMGFIDDVEWILDQTPARRQIALFSATMPKQIRRIATKYLNKPEEIIIKVKTTTAETIRQRFWPVSGVHKLDALTRILEAESFDAMLVFVRTRISTVELSEKLEARGYAAAPLNGDIQQKTRERTVESIKKGKLDILVATDVAARGLDIDRISHVVNYDIPHDTESYVHRIGRTGRAGREGDAILFVAPREKRMLSAIEKATRKKIDIMELPSTELINDKRIARFKERITDTLATENLGLFPQLIEQYQQEHNVPAEEIAAALAHLLQGDIPLLLQNKPKRKERDNKKPDSRKSRNDENRPSKRPATSAAPKPRNEESRPSKRPATSAARKPREEPKSSARKMALPEQDMERFRVEVGHSHDVKPGNIVGAIANEAGLDGEFIGHIDIRDEYSLIDLPEGMPKDIFNDLKKVWVAGRQLKISRLTKQKKSQSPDKSKNKTTKSDNKTGTKTNTTTSHKTGPVKKARIKKGKKKKEQKRASRPD